MFEHIQAGTVYWITGLSGAGKTSVGTLLYKKLKQEEETVIFLDGDILRDVFRDFGGYSADDRKKYAKSYGRLCKMLSDQGFNVVCCTISMFDDVRRWNRENIKSYKEIFLDVPLDVLIKRDQKGLYSQIKENQTANVVGMDLKLDLPKNPDIRIINDGTETPLQAVEKIWKSLVEKS